MTPLDPTALRTPERQCDVSPCLERSSCRGAINLAHMSGRKRYGELLERVRLPDN